MLFDNNSLKVLESLRKKKLNIFQLECITKIEESMLIEAINSLKQKNLVEEDTFNDYNIAYYCINDFGKAYIDNLERNNLNHWKRFLVKQVITIIVSAITAFITSYWVVDWVKLLK